MPQFSLDAHNALSDFISRIEGGNAVVVDAKDYAALEARVSELEKDAARYRVARRVISLHDLYSAADSTEDYSREVDMLIDRLMGSAT